MTRLTEAQQRLDNALARLESALRESNIVADPQRETMVRELAAMRARCDVMEDRSHTVSGRLDATISRVRSLVGE